MECILHILVMASLYVILATSFNLLIGFAGLFALSHAPFYALGAYVTALLTMQLGIPFPIPILLGVVFVAAAGSLVALPAIRVSLREAGPDRRLARPRADGGERHHAAQRGRAGRGRRGGLAPRVAAAGGQGLWRAPRGGTGAGEGALAAASPRELLRAAGGLDRRAPGRQALELHDLPAASRAGLWPWQPDERRGGVGALARQDRERLPYAVALVELDEGLRVMGNAGLDLGIGVRVSLCYAAHGERWLLRFDPLEQEPS